MIRPSDMLSYLSSPFARSAQEAPAASEASSSSTQLRNKPSLRRKASATRGSRGGRLRAGNCKSTLGSLHTEPMPSHLPPPLIPPRSSFNSPVKCADEEDEENEDLLETQLDVEPFESSLEDEEALEAQRMMEEIEEAENLYAILGVDKKVLDRDLRKAYMARCRIVHPDKHTSRVRPLATAAFQSLSYAYETLSSLASRKAYDFQMVLDTTKSSTPKTPRHSGDGAAADETLNGVLRAVWCEFLIGDFEMIRSMVGAINETAPAVHVGDHTVDTIQGALERLRGALLSGGKYIRVVRFELIRLYEIQLALRQLRWFDIKGRVRLTIQLARVTISIPLAIDRAMLADTDDSEGSQPATLLGSRMSCMLGAAVGLLEGSEVWLGEGRDQVAERGKRSR